MVSNCTIWPSELDQIGFTCFRPGETKESPLSIFFGTARHFFRIFFRFFFPQSVSPAFFDVLRQNGCWKIPKGSSFQFFFGIVRFFPENEKKYFSSIFSCFATEWMLKNLKGSPFSVFRHCETLARHSVHFFSM